MYWELVYGCTESCLEHSLSDVLWSKGFSLHSECTVWILQVYLPGMNSSLLVEFGAYLGQAIAALNIRFEL